MPPAGNPLEQADPLGGGVRGRPDNMPLGRGVAHIANPDGNAVNLTHPV